MSAGPCVLVGTAREDGAAGKKDAAVLALREQVKALLRAGIGGDRESTAAGERDGVEEAGKEA